MQSIGSTIGASLHYPPPDQPNTFSFFLSKLSKSQSSGANSANSSTTSLSNLLLPKSHSHNRNISTSSTSSLSDCSSFKSRSGRYSYTSSIDSLPTLFLPHSSSTVSLSPSVNFQVGTNGHKKAKSNSHWRSKSALDLEESRIVGKARRILIGDEGYPSPLPPRLVVSDHDFYSEEEEWAENEDDDFTLSYLDSMESRRSGEFDDTERARKQNVFEEGVEEGRRERHIMQRGDENRKELKSLRQKFTRKSK
ncbi:hypothetical protein BT69DRAFT_1315869 [Atractiella rhizophila]|nr:hypothetical protein BT69DRAFT_1315869 [Atractiella rhizophila]